MNIELLTNLNVLTIKSVSNIYTEKGKGATRSNRPTWAIALKYEGETVYKKNGKTFISNANNIVILPKGCNYQWNCIQSGHFYIVEFDCDSSFDTIFSIPISNHEKILQIFKDCEYKRTLKNPIYKIALLKNLYEILFLILSPLSTKSYQTETKRQKIAPALDFIVKNYHQKIRNDELAAMVGMSTVYFRKTFTAIFGVSPIAYIHQIRIKKAKEILKSDYGSLSEIAISLGYADLYDFSRTFKKYIGISPSEFAKNYKS